jgi:pimeloyl-ACP methyl ester carboxylesterase
VKTTDRNSCRRRLWAALACCVLLAPLSACGDDDPPDDTSTTPGTPTEKVVETNGTTDVGSHSLYAECAGEGGPTVVFLHGLGGEGHDWAMAAELLEGTHTCWYDRLGVGLSDQDAARHSALDSVEDLHRLLPMIGAEPPYILVGHSYGGMLALMYAGTHPDEVGGMVLADASLPFEPELDPPGTEDDVRADMDDNQENLDAYDGYATVQDLASSVPDVPITVMNGKLTELPAEWSTAAYNNELRAWVRTLGDGTLYQCDCDHDMPSDVPQLVADKVLEVITELSS